VTTGTAQGDLASSAPAARRPLRRRLVGVLAILGPGLIAANAGNDAGGIATYASAGAQFGYRTLFLMVLVTVGLVVVQEMCARLGSYTGQGLGALLREQFSLRTAAFALALLMIANTALVVSEFAGIAAAMDILGWKFNLFTNDIQASTVGFLGIAVALLGRNTASGTVAAAVLFGALLTGTSNRNINLSIDPTLVQYLTFMIEGIIILLVSTDVITLRLLKGGRRIGVALGRRRPQKAGASKGEAS